MHSPYSPWLWTWSVVASVTEGVIKFKFVYSPHVVRSGSLRAQAQKLAASHTVRNEGWQNMLSGQVTKQERTHSSTGQTGWLSVGGTVQDGGDVGDHVSQFKPEFRRYGGKPPQKFAHSQVPSAFSNNLKPRRELFMTCLWNNPQKSTLLIAGSTVHRACTLPTPSS